MSRVSLINRIISIVIVWAILLSFGITRGEKAPTRQFYPIGCFSRNLNNVFSQEHPSTKVTVLGPPAKYLSIIEQCAETCKGFFEGYDYVLAILKQVCVCLTLFFGEVQLSSIPDDCCGLKIEDNNSYSTIGGINAFNVFCEAKEWRSKFENTTFTKEATSCTEFTEMYQNFDNPRINETSIFLPFPSQKLIPCNSNNCTFLFNKNGQLCQNFEMETEGGIGNQSSSVILFLTEYIPNVEDNPKLCIEYCTNSGAKTFQYIDSQFKYAMVSTVFIQNIGFFGLCQCSNDSAKFEERNIKICEKCPDHAIENETTYCYSSHSNITNAVYTYCNMSDATECLISETSENEPLPQRESTWFLLLCITIVLILLSLSLFFLVLLVRHLCSSDKYDSILDIMENTLTSNPTGADVDKVFHTYHKDREETT